LEQNLPGGQEQAVLSSTPKACGRVPSSAPQVGKAVGFDSCVRLKMFWKFVRKGSAAHSLKGIRGPKLIDSAGRRSKRKSL
jgi:hypothetical protein